MSETVRALTSATHQQLSVGKRAPKAQQPLNDSDLRRSSRMAWAFNIRSSTVNFKFSRSSVRSTFVLYASMTGSKKSAGDNSSRVESAICDIEGLREQRLLSL